MQVFLFHACDELVNRGNVMNAADTLTGTPDILPDLSLGTTPAAKVHGGFVAVGQIVGIKT